MMGVFGTIDLTDWPFWLCVLAALLIQPIQINNFCRRLTLAVVNLGFVTWLLGTTVWLPVSLVTVIWLIARSFAASDRVRRAGRIAAVVVLAILLIDYRLQPVALKIFPALAAIGFAYVSLRSIELLRGCWEDQQAASLIDCVNYLIPFHMLAAGPIEHWRDFLQHDQRTTINAEQTLYALERIANGVFKKFVLAYAINEVFLTGFQTSGYLYVIEVQAFYIWLFLDFSGYSDVAVGVGTLIGVHTPENFSRPYLARNMVDFWDRWHITLSLFLRRNIFVPLQLNMLRLTNGKSTVWVSVFVFFVTFAISAAWHSVTPGFLVWGFTHAVGVSVVVCYRHVLKKRLGTMRFKSYQKQPIVRFCAIVLTFQYVAWTLTAIVSL